MRCHCRAEPGLTSLIAGSAALSVPSHSLLEYCRLPVLRATPGAQECQHWHKMLLSAEAEHSSATRTPQTRSGTSREMLICPQQLSQVLAGSEAKQLLFPLP